MKPKTNESAESKQKYSKIRAKQLLKKRKAEEEAEDAIKFNFRDDVSKEDSGSDSNDSAGDGDEEISPEIRVPKKSQEEEFEESQKEIEKDLKDSKSANGIPTETQFPEDSILNKIKNRLRRNEMYVKYKKEKKKAKLDERKRRAKEYESIPEADRPPKQVPKTIENMREPDVTMVQPDDEEVLEDEAVDQMADYFRGEREPKVLITSVDNPHKKTIMFCRELMQTIPNAEFRWRNRTSIKKMCRCASTRGFTDIVIVNEDWRRPNAILFIHLPDGPTAFFRLSSVKYCKKIKRRAQLSTHRPEVILNNFNTRLGHSIARMFAVLFHFDPQFKGRRVVTLHNQRDYVFFRHHRYEFKSDEKVALQEIGPRFTLKLKWLQNSTFDTKHGEYEWLLKRHEMQSSRRKFFL